MDRPCFILTKLTKYKEMRSSFLKLRERVQAPQNTKQISNYIYYPDFVLGQGNYSTVYEAISKKTSKNFDIQSKKSQLK